MRVRFWGVRGSIPTPGPDTIRYGGNTACISVDLTASTTLVLDAGTGIRLLGDSVSGPDHTFYVALSHLHWDHIQGFPLFRPLGREGTRLQFVSPESVSWGTSVCEQFGGDHFPVGSEAIPASITYDDASDNSVVDQLAPFFSSIEVFRSRHPGGCFGYRFSVGGQSLVYLTDNELPDAAALAETDPVVAFCESATFLIHDAQYLKEEMPEKTGWGHSDVSSVCRLAILAGVENLYLFHHDPSRSDEELDAIGEMARKQLQSSGSTCESHVAAEGDQFDLGDT
jgi:phosphoribosyl 1,2-cyclic phosphodiesterase